MAYPALPDHRMGYDNDGSVVAVGVRSSFALDFASGITAYLTGAQRIELNDSDFADTGVTNLQIINEASGLHVWFFFPERREITAMIVGFETISFPGPPTITVQGSNDSTNGVDGTWETASLPGGAPFAANSLDQWRSLIKAVSFTGGKKVLRFGILGGQDIALVHLYGEKVAGQTPDDLVYIDHDTTPGVEYGASEDFGDRPLGTSVVRQFRVKNVSPTKTANAINLQCNDPDFAISTDGVVWVVTINIASLAAGAESATMFIRNTTPAPGVGLLGPRFARIVGIVGSYT